MFVHQLVIYFHGNKIRISLTVSQQITTINSTGIHDFVGIIVLTIAGKISLPDHIATLFVLLKSLHFKGGLMLKQGVYMCVCVCVCVCVWF
jgi:hypothetical protein